MSLYFISIFLDRRLEFDPTFQLKGWNLRALQNETHMRTAWRPNNLALSIISIFPLDVPWGVPPPTTHPVVDISFLFAIDSSICAPKKGTEEDRWKVVVIHRECCRLLLEVHLHYQLTLLVQPSSSFLFLELVPLVPVPLVATNCRISSIIWRVYFLSFFFLYIFIYIWPSFAPPYPAATSDRPHAKCSLTTFAVQFHTIPASHSRTGLQAEEVLASKGPIHMSARTCNFLELDKFWIWQDFVKLMSFTLTFITLHNSLAAFRGIMYHKSISLLYSEIPCYGEHSGLDTAKC